MMRTWMAVVLTAFLLAACGNDTPGPEKEVVETEEAEEAREVEEAREAEEAEEAREAEEAEEAGEVKEEKEAREAEKAGEVKEEKEAREAEEEKEAEEAEELEEPVIEAALADRVIVVDEVKAVWLSYLDLKPVFNEGEGSESDYRAYINEVVVNMKSLGLNTLIYQVRPFGDALYPSQIFPTSHIITGTEGDALAYDPFGIAVAIAHEHNLRIEAWINPFRIRTSKSQVPLADSNQAALWYEDGTRRVMKSPEGTMVYNPASVEVQDRIVAGVLEIIEAYPVDGIHFDDYFYPTTLASFDEADYLGFLHDNDSLSHDEWRRLNVNTLIRRVYAQVKEADEGVVFGISPDGDIDANFTRHYADVSLWLSEDGYIDYLMPQIYYGYDHGRLPYEAVLNQWHYLNEGNKKLIPAIAAYKVGKEDQWAGESGLNEWVESEGILLQMVDSAKGQPSYWGYALYRYGSLFEPSDETMIRMAFELEALTRDME